MADKAKKISEFTAATSVAANDLFVVVSNTSGVATTKKITSAALFANVVSNSNFVQIKVGANVLINTSTIAVGNSTVNVLTNATSINVGPVSINTTSLKIGNNTVNAVINSTAFFVSGADGIIKAGNFQWKFDYSDGLFYVPVGDGNTSGIAFPNDAGGGSGDYSYIEYRPLGGGSEDMTLELRVRNNNDDRIRLDSSGDVQIVAAGATNPKLWDFNPNGSIVFPDTTAQTTAWVGIPGPYADDAAAAAANVAIGYPYHKTGTGGQVFVRLT